MLIRLHTTTTTIITTNTNQPTRDSRKKRRFIGNAIFSHDYGTINREYIEHVHIN